MQANKQSVADALHKKSNKISVAKEIGGLKSLISQSVRDLKTQIESKNNMNNLPIETISTALTAIAKEVRQGVIDSKRGFADLDQRVFDVEQQQANLAREEQQQVSGGRREIRATTTNLNQPTRPRRSSSSSSSSSSSR